MTERKKLRLGMPTLIELASFEENAALCAELGLDFVELNMNLPIFQPGRMDTEKLRKIADRYGVGVTVHLDENLDVCEFNPYVAEAYRRTAVESIGLAKELGAPLLNMHLSKGVYFTLPDQKVFLYDTYSGEYIESMRRFASVCGEAAGDVQILIENTSGFTDFHREALEMLLESPVFGLTFDVGHNHGCGDRDEAFIRAHKAKLRHMHLHDALGKRDHLALGSGELDLEGYLDLACETDSSVVVEVKTVTGLRQSMEWIKEINIQQMG